MDCILLDYGQTLCHRDWSSIGSNAKFYKLYYCLDGEAIYTCSENQIILLPRHLYIIQENSPYRIVTKADGFFNVLWAHVDYFLPLTQTLFAFCIMEESAEYYLLRAMQCSIHGSQQLLHDLVAILSDIVVYSKGLLKTYDTDIVSSIAYINQNYKKNIKNHEIATHFGYNENYFILKFRKALGVTPHKYLIQVKMTHSKRYLLALKSVSQASELAGYENPNTFSRDFKKYFGYSPTEYLRSTKDFI